MEFLVVCFLPPFDSWTEMKGQCWFLVIVGKWLFVVSEEFETTCVSSWYFPFFIFIFPFTISSLGRSTYCCMVLQSWHYETAPCYIVSKAPSTIKMLHPHYVHQHIFFHNQRIVIVNPHSFISLPWDQNRSNFRICSLNFMKVYWNEANRAITQISLSLPILRGKPRAMLSFPSSYSATFFLPPFSLTLNPQKKIHSHAYDFLNNFHFTIGGILQERRSTVKNKIQSDERVDNHPQVNKTTLPTCSTKP